MILEIDTEKKIIFVKDGITIKELMNWVQDVLRIEDCNEYTIKMQPRYEVAPHLPYPIYRRNPMIPCGDAYRDIYTTCSSGISPLVDASLLQ